MSLEASIVASGQVSVKRYGFSDEVLNTTCPLKQPWQDYGLDDEDVAKMCDIGSAIDYGKLEGAGFRFECETWTAGKRGCCTLKAYAPESPG